MSPPNIAPRKGESGLRDLRDWIRVPGMSFTQWREREEMMQSRDEGGMVVWRKFSSSEWSLRRWRVGWVVAWMWSSRWRRCSGGKLI